MLLAHLRLIKANGANNSSQQLNEGANNWLTKTRAEMLTELTAPIAPAQLAALKEYKAAAEEVRTGGGRQNDLDIIAKNLA